MLHWSSRFWF